MSSCHVRIQSCCSCFRSSVEQRAQDGECACAEEDVGVSRRGRGCVALLLLLEVDELVGAELLGQRGDGGLVGVADFAESCWIEKTHTLEHCIVSSSVAWSSRNDATCCCHYCDVRTWLIACVRMQKIWNEYVFENPKLARKIYFWKRQYMKGCVICGAKYSGASFSQV